MFFIPQSLLQRFIRNFLEYTILGPADYVDIKEHYVDMDIYNEERQFVGTRRVWICEGRSY
jgi:hypothetical protein